jgi:hypothetical protein
VSHAHLRVLKPLRFGFETKGPVSTSSTASTFDDGLVEQQDLLLIRRLKNRCPLFEVSPCDGCGSPLPRYIATLRASDELFYGHLEVMQLDSDPERSRPESFLIAFNSRPVAPLQNHAVTLSEEILGKNPQLTFEPNSKLFVPDINTEARCPLVLVQPDGWDFRCKLTSESRFARGGKPTDQHEPRGFRHARFLAHQSLAAPRDFAAPPKIRALVRIGASE